MRKAFSSQLRLDCLPIERLKLNLNCRDEIVPLLEAALALEAAGPWGQGFPEPQFDDRFTVAAAHLMGSAQQHVQLR